MSKSKMIAEAVSRTIGKLGLDNPNASAELAKLRRGAGKSIMDSPESWSLVLYDLPEELLSKSVDGTKPTEAEIAIHAALTLFAIHQQGVNTRVNTAGISFGGALRRMVRPGDENAMLRMIRRFNAVITASDVTELTHHARGLIQMMRSAEPPIGLDYPRFAKDLYNYQFPDGRRSVILRWGQDFYMADKQQNSKEDMTESE